MRFIAILNYVRVSYQQTPAYILLMDTDDGVVEFISHGCQFVPNNDVEREKLLKAYKCKEYLKELDAAPPMDPSEIECTMFMFRGCPTVVEFNCGLPNIKDQRCMFNR